MKKGMPAMRTSDDRGHRLAYVAYLSSPKARAAKVEMAHCPLRACQTVRNSTSFYIATILCDTRARDNVPFPKMPERGRRADRGILSTRDRLSRVSSTLKTATAHNRKGWADVPGLQALRVLEGGNIPFAAVQAGVARE